MTARARLAGLLRRWDGPLTRDLSLAPGRFGLGKVPARLAPDATTGMICGYCSTGCSLEVHLRDGWAVNLSPTADYPVNRGMACPKGWEALTPLASPDRATRPLLRSARGRLEPVSWDEAMRAFVGRVRAIQRAHGPASVAFLGSGQLPCEELALFGALAKFGMGMVHGDGNTRQCMATAAVAYKQSFGFDAPPYTYRDLEESDVIVLWGSNLCVAHPILWERVCRNPHRPAIVVVDPRRTETAMAATQHVALRPKSDLVLLYGLARLLIERGWIDRGYIDAHTRGFDDLCRHVAPYSLDRVCEGSGLGAAEIVTLAETIGRGERVSLWWTMGINQSHEGVRTAQGLVNLALMTGNLGRPGTGANSITGQCNAMGSRLFGNTTTLLGGHDFVDPAHRARVSRVLGIDEGRIPRQAGWAYDQILEGVRAGAIKALWIVGTNPAHSWIDQGALDEVFARLELVVVQDMYATTETARRADLVLPAAGWGEKEGTFINSERRIGLIKRVARSPGEALADFDVFRLIASYWGCADLFRRWSSPEEVFGILAELSRGQPCDFSGIRGYRMIDEAGGIQWPLAEGAAPIDHERRLLADGAFFTPDGRARFHIAEPTPLPEAPCADYPLLLLTGRGSSSQWHTETRTGTSAVLAGLAPRQLHVELHPDDARRRGVVPGERVRVSSRRGSITARALVTRVVQPGQVFAPMHHDVVNRLTFPAFDPHSRQPSYKACAVDVEPLSRPDRRAASRGTRE